MSAKAAAVLALLSVALAATPLPEDHHTFTDFEAIVKHVNQVRFSVHLLHQTLVITFRCINHITFTGFS
jgi:hypothetical protein